MIHRRGYRTCSGVLIALGLAGTLVTSAHPGICRAEDDQARTEARQAFNQGRQLYEQRRYRKAISMFERANQLRAHFMVLCSIARCYEQLNEFVTAKSYYGRCLSGGADKHPTAGEVRRSLQAVTSQLTWISIRSPGAGGAVYIDGKAVGRAPLRIAVNPGTHSVEVRRPNATSARANVDSLGGEERTLTLVPLDLRPALPGDSASQPAAALSSASDDDGLSPWLFWGGAVLTAGLAATASVFSLQTLDRKAAYEDEPTQDGYDAFTSRRLLANILWASTLAAGASTTALYFFTNFGGSSERQTEQKATALGVGLRGAF